MKTTLVVSLLSAASSVMAHGYVQEFLIGGQRHTGSLPFNDQYKKPAPDRITQPFWENGNSFVSDVKSKDIACNKGAKPAKLVAKAPAGSDVTFFWTEWPESHKGPVITYLADCGGDCTTAVGSELNWFKIHEAGLMPDGSWAATALIKNNNTWTVTLPRKIKNGQYLLRHEIIALHASHDLDGSQFYPSCTNIEITGATEENTPETVKLPGAYDRQDPGIFINIYYPPVTSYVVPGPPVYTEDGTSSPAPQPVEPAPEDDEEEEPSAFPTFVPTETEGVYPTGDAPIGTGGAPTVAPVPTDAPTPEDFSTSTEYRTHTVVTTIVTTIAGQEVTLTASYKTCSSGMAAPSVAPVPVEPACAGQKTVTVTEQITMKYDVATVTETVTKTETVESAPTKVPEPEVVEDPDYVAPTTSLAGVPAVPTDNGFSTISAPANYATTTATIADVPTATATETTYEPSGTGAPLTGYESAFTGPECDQAYETCKRSFDGCMRRAKRSGMQTRSCLKFKRDVCNDGLTGCHAKVKRWL